MKVSMTEAICQEGMALLEGKAEIFVAHDAHPHNYLDQLRNTDAFIVRVADKGAIDRKTMESSPSLKVIGRTGIGYDSVDVEAATELGIPVVITPGANNRSVAEHAVALMLALSKNMVESDVEQRRGNWKIRDAKKIFEVEEKTCLIIGLGTIGKIIAHLCLGLDMKVIGYDTFLTREQMAELGVTKADDKFEALRSADVVIVQMPLIEGVTTNTIAKAELDASSVPKLWGVLLFLLGVFLLVRGSRELSQAKKAGYIPQKNAAGDTVRAFLQANSQVILMFTALALFIALITPLGFLISCFLFLLAEFNILARKEERKPVVSLILALAASVLIYSLFKYAFQMPLPAGILQGIF